MFFAFGDYSSHPGRLGSKPHSNDISRGSILCMCCEAIPSPSLSHRMDLSSGSASRTKSFERPEEIYKIWTIQVVGETNSHATCTACAISSANCAATLPLLICAFDRVEECNYS